MSDTYQILLSGKRQSGRGVRFSPLSAPAHDQLQLDAAKTLGPEGTMLELRSTEYRMGTRRMVTAVTKQTGLKDLTAATWQTVGAAELDEKWDEFFNSKDDSFLLGLYREYHECNAAEYEDVAKNVQMVAL